jgi:Transposase DDE domain group 1
MKNRFGGFVFLRLERRLVRYRSFQYQAASWDRPRRVIAKVEDHLRELSPRVGVIVATLTGTNRAVVHFYTQRGTAEQWIKEGKEATHWTRLSCHRFRANEVRGSFCRSPSRASP